MIRAILLSLLLFAPAAGQEFRQLLSGDTSLGSATLGGNVSLYGDTADALAIRGGADPQSIYTYNTYTDASNYERLAVAWSSNTARILTESSGTGSARAMLVGTSGAANLSLRTSGVTRFYIHSAGDLIPNADNTYDIGTVTNAIADIHFDGVAYLGSGTELVGNGDGGLIVRNTTDTARLTVDATGNTTTAGTLTAGGNLAPAANSTYYSGTVDARWQREYVNDLFVYNEYTDASNYERGRLYWASDSMYLRTNGQGTGSQNPIVVDGSAIAFQTGATTRWNIDGSDLYPAADNTYDIGKDGNRVRSLHLAGPMYRSVTAGITASTTQTQGQGPLTAWLNEVSTVANANDTVTLPTAVAGMEVVVCNNGANTLQIFPASGDNLGAGIDTATTLAAGSNVTYVSYDATNWEVK